MFVEVGNIVEGKVSGITNFGAFIQLPEGKTGLVHISEVAEEYVKDIKDHLKDGQVVNVKIISIDNANKISLSIKQAKDSKSSAENIQNNSSKKSKNIPNVEASFEDRLAKFMKDSDEKLHDLKKSVESKRGSGGYRKTGHF